MVSMVMVPFRSSVMFDWNWRDRVNSCENKASSRRITKVNWPPLFLKIARSGLHSLSACSRSCSSSANIDCSCSLSVAYCSKKSSRPLLVTTLCMRVMADRIPLWVVKKEKTASCITQADSLRFSLTRKDLLIIVLIISKSKRFLCRMSV